MLAACQVWSGQLPHVQDDTQQYGRRCQVRRTVGIMWRGMSFSQCAARPQLHVSTSTGRPGKGAEAPVQQPSPLLRTVQRAPLLACFPFHRSFLARCRGNPAYRAYSYEDSSQTRMTPAAFIGTEPPTAASMTVRPTHSCQVPGHHSDPAPAWGTALQEVTCAPRARKLATQPPCVLQNRSPRLGCGLDLEVLLTVERPPGPVTRVAVVLAAFLIRRRRLLLLLLGGSPGILCLLLGLLLRVQQGAESTS